MPVEERTNEGSFPTLEKASHHKSEKAAEEQKDDNKNISERRGEIRREFAFGDGFDVSPGVHFFSWEAPAVSGMVMLRKTSSSRPSSVCNSSIRQPCAASAMLDASAPLTFDLGKMRTVTLVASSRNTVVRLTTGNCESF